METRICSKCGEEKPLDSSHFSIQRTGKYGFRASCKKCVTKQTMDATNYRENMRRAARKYRAQRGNELALKNKEYRHQNPEKIKSLYKKWSKQNREKIRDRQRRAVDDLARYYLKFRIKKEIKCPINEITEEMIEQKRSQLMLLRAIKDFQKERANGSAAK